MRLIHVFVVEFDVTEVPHPAGRSVMIVGGFGVGVEGEHFKCTHRCVRGVFSRLRGTVGRQRQKNCQH